MRTRFLSFALAAALCASLSGSKAFAEVSAADRGTARQLVISGMDALDRKDFAAAADYFERANGILVAPTITLGLGRARLGQGKLVLAQDAFSQAANTPIRPDTSPAFKEAIEAAGKALAALAPRVPVVTIEVRGTTGAKVTVDDAEVPAVGLGVPRPVDPGSHRVRARAPGFVPVEATFSVKEGQREKVVLELKTGPGADPLEKPGATTPTGSGAPTSPQVPPSAAPSHILAYTTMGVGAAGVLVGGIFGGMAVGAKSNLSKECPQNVCLSAQAQSDHSAANTDALVSTIAISVGAAAVATGAVLWFVQGSPSKVDDAPKAAQLVPSFGPQGGGLAVIGSF